MSWLEFFGFAALYIGATVLVCRIAVMLTIRKTWRYGIGSLILGSYVGLGLLAVSFIAGLILLGYLLGGGFA